MICGLVVGLFSVHAATYQAGSWQVEITLVPDKAEILLGEPTSLSYIVRNLSREDRAIRLCGDYQNDLLRHSSFQVRAQPSEGSWE